jgi:hypothetical protein
MLIIETTSNGQRMVKVKKDWHPGRMGSQYTRPLPNFMEGEGAERVQHALLKKPMASLTPWWVGM